MALVARLLVNCSEAEKGNLLVWHGRRESGDGGGDMHVAAPGNGECLPTNLDFVVNGSAGRDRCGDIQQDDSAM